MSVFVFKRVTFFYLAVFSMNVQKCQKMPSIWNVNIVNNKDGGINVVPGKRQKMSSIRNMNIVNNKDGGIDVVPGNLHSKNTQGNEIILILSKILYSIIFKRFITFIIRACKNNICTLFLYSRATDKTRNRRHR